MQDSGVGRFDVREFGATGDGTSEDTAALQRALDECAGAGGTVVLPPGEYRTAPLVVGDHTTLRLESGATLQFVGDYEKFPTAESRWEGWDQVGFQPCLSIADAENVAVTGRGAIDGGGQYWWDFYGTPRDELPAGLRERLETFDERNGKSDDVSSFTLRPPLFQIAESSNVTVSGVTLRNSPFWNTHVVYSDDVTIHDVTVENPASAPNGDGIDVDSSRHVRISDSYINAGDDAICIKSGKDAEGRAVGRPAAQITVTNCTVDAGHGGVVVGSEMSGDVRDVTVSNCTFTDTDRGVRIKTQRGRGGVVEDLRFDTIVMRRVACPFVINGYYFTDIDSDPAPVDEGTPMVRNVHFHDVTVREAESAGFFAGLPEQHFEGITFDDVVIDATRSLDATDLDPAMADGYEQRHGLFCKSIADISLRNVRIRTPDAPVLTFEETGQVAVDGLEATADEAGPTVRAENVDRTLVRGCDLGRSPAPFLRITGEGAQVVDAAGNHGALADHVAAGDAGDVTIASDD